MFTHKVERLLIVINDYVISACTAAIYRAVMSLSGIKHASVSLITNSLDVTYDPLLITPSAIVNTVSDMGYDVVKWDHIETNQLSQVTGTKDDRTVELKVEGMMCGWVKFVFVAAPVITLFTVNARVVLMSPLNPSTSFHSPP